MAESVKAKNGLYLDDLTTPRLRKPPRKIDEGSAPTVMNVDEYFRQQYFIVRLQVYIIVFLVL